MYVIAWVWGIAHFQFQQPSESRNSGLTYVTVYWFPITYFSTKIL
jgi:hypothetical protein